MNVKNRFSISQVEFHLGLDWLLYISKKHGDNFYAILKEMEGSLTLDRSGYPVIDFLSIPELKHDLDMKTEMEINLLDMELNSSSLSKQQYDKRVNKVLSPEYQKKTKTDFLKECKEDSLEVSVLSAELLVHLLSNSNEEVLKIIKYSGEELSSFSNKFFEKFSNEVGHPLELTSTLLKFLRNTNITKNINIDCNYTVKDWVEHFQQLIIVITGIKNTAS